ncbi:CoA-binding protein [Nocardiopsis gilva YIM 90087]|uniref:CoA-binding protein n=1 Tax=Nocardiopsis gilva YIM 90087 TaxID=1235441 RepID=A0A223SBI1_9ACTN|nr:CoA-binding protein [Nocardiopsis gilva]ASU85528.1 CoA-binding protein [Nocardiopsis gilva YIM 90087]
MSNSSHANGDDVSDDVIRRILRESEVWAVVGLGNNPRRPAYGVARFLQAHGKRIVPVHPTAATVHGERGYASLADIPFEIDVADVFRRSEDAGGVADEALARDDITTVWFQLGVIDHAAAQRVRDAGRTMVMDHCPAIEWPRLLG